MMIPVTESEEIHEIIEELFIENYDERQAVRLPEWGNETYPKS